jgi:hypothetical protein
MLNIDVETDLYYFALQLRDNRIPYERRGFIFKLPMCDVVFKNNLLWKIHFKHLIIICSSRNCVNGMLFNYYNLYVKYCALKKLGMITDISKYIIEFLL